ncbi:hypothetical protein ACIG0C_30020 [Kitasatospora aureofaciens]|uniref:Uncharacterized protein n=1 Tax=Kitasatospora aureofaciens TaxID=1894 RepID=A0A1E7NE44_KITAU|nr:hypothetical protein [Kitasatospora aureofaciens]ARF83196.1 hypothetical protein B6264_30090 [Kitasatospora aureofaciens]OEV38970.1 hypothetical protein HS99_0017830 [Kitasatospora aureofaciens]GGU99167.1 hypothetical protein GCM10010502_61960 [Kitasatospora aureofaciens]
MTTSPLSRLPSPFPAEAEHQAAEHDDQALDADQLAALHRARDTGEAAAAWVRSLASRQANEPHALVLERAAEAIERASHQEVIPGGDGELTEELRYSLAADVLLGATHTATLPDLAPGERIPLVAVCALAAAMPSCVLGDLPRELTLLADELDAATTAGRAATTATGSAG